MKKNLIKSLCLLAALGALLICPAHRAEAQQLTNTILQTFDTGGNTAPFAGSGSVAGWLFWYSIYGNVDMTNDPSMDADGNPASGSLKISIPFTSSGNQQIWFGSFEDYYEYDLGQTANAVNYSNITFKVRVAAGTQPDNNGNFGSIGVGLLANFNNGGTPGIMSYQTIPGAASNGWVTITAPIDKTAADLNAIGAFDFNYNSYGGYPTFPITFWIDDVAMNASTAPPPPPILSTEPAKVGFNAIAGSGGNNDRESIMSTTTSGDTWVGRPSPVTYSFNVSSFPSGSANDGFMMYMFLIPGPNEQEGNQAAPYNYLPTYETAPDYNETNVVFLDIEDQAYNVTNGNTVTSVQGAQAIFRYKANDPNDNSMIYGINAYTNTPGSGSANFGSGVLGKLNCPSAIGTWSITFNNNTSVTLTGPNGSSTSFTMPAADAALFTDAGGFTFLMGCQANNGGNLGQRAVFSNVSITGVASPISDNFALDTTLNTNEWALLGANNAGLLVVPAGSAYWIDWTLPDVGFSIQQATTLSGGDIAWSDPGLPTIGPLSGTRRILVPNSSRPGPKTGFYRMVQRTFTQLQVLLPGETNAPDTATGKIGTPTPESPGANITVTINAVDANYHIITDIGDTINLTSDDGTAFLPNPTPMANGTLQEVVNLDTDGSNPGEHTVTATDQSNGAITPATSSQVLVQ